MIVHYPMATSVLTEARLYAADSIQHTMDYNGWKDQHKKRERIIYGNFGQLWVSEFCRLNGIEHTKDASSPETPDDYDLIVHGYRVDVKTSVHRDLVGQVSPGVIGKPCDYFCFMLTDKLCSFIAPFGLIEAERYREQAVRVEKGEIIPGTRLEQRFGHSFFLPQNPELIPFVHFMVSKGRARSRVIQPSTIVSERSVEDLSDQINTTNRLMLEVIKSLNSQRKPSSGKVLQMPASNDLFAEIGA